MALDSCQNFYPLNILRIKQSVISYHMCGFFIIPVMFFFVVFFSWFLLAETQYVNENLRFVASTVAGYNCSVNMRCFLTPRRYRASVYIPAC